MNDQKKKTVAWAVGIIVLIAIVIGGIFGVKHYVKEQTYEKPINAVIEKEHDSLDKDDKKITKNNSKTIVYDDPDEGNNYLITVTYYSKEQNSTITDQYVVDKTTNHAEYQGEQIPVSNLKKLYESDHLKK